MYNYNENWGPGGREGGEVKGVCERARENHGSRRIGYNEKLTYE